MTTFTPSFGILTLSLVWALFGTGCSTTSGSGAGKFASVTIVGQSGEQIRKTTATVFRENGYKLSTPGEMMVFNKEGTRVNTISRDGLIAAQAGVRTIVRVKVEVEYLDAGSHRLQCQAYMVSGAGDSFFEEEHRVSSMRSRPYQNLLDEVAKRLQQP